MSASENNTQPGRGATELHSTTTAVRALEATVKVLETHRDTMAAASEIMRLDVRDMRDRMARLETKVDHLPTKEWLDGRLYKAVGLTAAVVTIIATILRLTGKG